VAADPASLAVVGHKDHRRAVELAARLQEREEIAHVPVRLGELFEVFGAPHPADVPELVRGQQLEHQKVRVFLLDHPARLRGQRAVDFAGRLHGCHGTDLVFAKRVEQMRDAHQATAAPVPLEHVEDRLAPDAEPRREVRAHAVLGGGRTSEHRREADDGPRRIRRLHRQVLGALAGEPVHDRSVRLPQPPPVAAVNHDHVHPPGKRGRLPLSASRPLRIPRQPLRERSRGDEPEPGRYRQRGTYLRDRAPGRLLRHQRRRAQRDQELWDLLQRVAARRVGVRGNEAPEAEAVRPRGSGPQVVVDRAPDHHREERVAGHRAREQRGRPPRLQERHSGERRQPEQSTPPQREGEAREHRRRRERGEQRKP
jgi:hypothetical protein